MARSRKDAALALAALAHEQGGYFTTKQAIQAGYGYKHLDYHETAGNFERVAHGLYRLPTVPPTEHDDLIRLSSGVGTRRTSLRRLSRMSRHSSSTT